MRAPRHRKFLCAAAAALLACSLSAAMNAQTLARPGWTGSGMTQEPWWRSAVFYRVAPEHFQDSDGDGVGDLRGVAERLDYLQALGVDAIVLQLPFAETGFDDLLAEASRRHIRLVIGLSRNPDLTPDGNPDRVGTNSFPGAEGVRAQARLWLSRGAAGILLPTAKTAGAAASDEDILLRSLRRLAAEYPGERVVIGSSALPAPATPLPASSAAAPLHLGTRALRLDSAQLILSRLAVPAIAGGALSPSAVRAALLQPLPGDGAPLLELSAPATADPEAAASSTSSAGSGRIFAALLLTQKGALLLEFGQELGAPAPSRMPWTPGNVTPHPEEPAAPAAPALPAPIVYGPYRPYIAPPPKPLTLATSGEANSPAQPALPAPPDIDTLPGFSTQRGDADPAPAAVTSVALQERDPHSLLNLYRTLLALHHGNATLRSGSFTLLHEDEDAAVVWLRRAPAGVRTVASVIVAVNCGDRAITLSLGQDLAQLHLRTSDLRSLLPGNTGSAAMNSDRLTLGPHAIFVGELPRSR